MGIIEMGRPSDDMSMEDLMDLISKTNKMVEYLVNGRIDSKNVFEVGGWRVTLEQMASRDGDVGFSTEDTGADDIRIWAGDAKDGSPKFKVTKSGIASMVSAIISSVLSGERVVIDGTGIHTYDASGVERLTIGTAPVKGVKAITGRDASGVAQSVYTYDTETTSEGTLTGQYVTAHNAYLLLDSNGDVRLMDSTGKGFRAVGGVPEVNDGFGWRNIARAGISTSSAGSHSHGIPDGAQLLGADGVTVYTFSSAGNHSHSQN